MTATHLSAPLLDRDVDVLDIAVAEACILSALGPDVAEVKTVRRDGFVEVLYDDVALQVLREVAMHDDDQDLAPWIDLCAPALVEAVVDRLGHQWRAEIELGVELLLAERTDDFATFAAVAAAGPVRAVAQDEAEILVKDAVAAGRSIMLVAS